MSINIPIQGKRIIIVGAGFAGLKLARQLSTSKYQVVLIDKNNYHQFQPLFYQVATAGLEPSAISFPLRKAFQLEDNVYVRVTKVLKVEPSANTLITELGNITYDYLVLAMGTDTNFFGMKNISERAMPMKSVSEALALRNKILQNLEDALVADTEEEKQGLLNIVIVGGGPTGVEVSGTLAEMKKNILPKDYPEIDFKKMNIHLVESSQQVLNVMADISSKKAKEYLEKLGVIVSTGTQVKDFDGKLVYLGDGTTIRSNNLIWAAGVAAVKLEGIDPTVIARGGRIKVDRLNKVEGTENIFAIGDIAMMVEDEYPNGHPQLSQPAMQQGQNLAKNFVNMLEGKPLKPFAYKNLGTMATVGKNLAVVELTFVKFQGFFAWLLWMFVHLMAILGVKNKLLIFVNWFWHYFTSDQSLRLIMKPKEKVVVENN